MAAGWRCVVSVVVGLGRVLVPHTDAICFVVFVLLLRVYMRCCPVCVQRGRTALHLAALEGHTELGLALLAVEGVDVNAKDLRKFLRFLSLASRYVCVCVCGCLLFSFSLGLVAALITGM